MTRDDFINEYCRRSHLTRDQLLKRRYIVPCRCSSDLCEGWAGVFRDATDLDLMLATGYPIEDLRPYLEMP